MSNWDRMSNWDQWERRHPVAYRVIVLLAWVLLTIIGWAIFVIVAVVVGFAAHAIAEGFHAGWGYWGT